MTPPERVTFTSEADEMLANLREKHGELMFHQSGGCCDGSSPMCFADGDFLVGDADVKLAEVAVGAGAGAFTVPFWMSRDQFERWKHTQLRVDVVPGRGAGFSLEAPEGVRFVIRSRVFSDEELSALEA